MHHYPPGTGGGDSLQLCWAGSAQVTAERLGTQDSREGQGTQLWFILHIEGVPAGEGHGASPSPGTDGHPKQPFPIPLTGPTQTCTSPLGRRTWAWGCCGFNKHVEWGWRSGLSLKGKASHKEKRFCWWHFLHVAIQSECSESVQM